MASFDVLTASYVSSSAYPAFLSSPVNSSNDALPERIALNISAPAFVPNVFTAMFMASVSFSADFICFVTSAKAALASFPSVENLLNAVRSPVITVEVCMPFFLKDESIAIDSVRLNPNCSKYTEPELTADTSSSTLAPLIWLAFVNWFIKSFDFSIGTFHRAMTSAMLLTALPTSTPVAFAK